MRWPGKLPALYRWKAGTTSLAIMNLIAAWRSRKVWQERAPGAWLMLAFGCAAIWLYFVQERKFPHEDELVEVTGPVVWSESASRGTLYFEVAGSSSRFVLFSKHDPGKRLRHAIELATEGPVTVRYFPKDRPDPLLGDGPSYTTYGLKIGGANVTPLTEVRDSVHRDNLAALLIGIPVALFGIARLAWLSRMRQR